MSALTRLLVTLADQWLPRHCALCDQTLPPARHGLCGACAQALPGRDAARCPRCGLAQRACTGGACRLADPPLWSHTLVLADYAPPLDRLLVALKFQGFLPAAEALGAPLGTLLTEAIRTGALTPPEALVPVPLGPTRLATRGYNQAERLARGAARTSGVPVRGTWLSRRRETPPQSELDLAARAHNLDHAFAADPAVRGRRVALVDDVMTSGSTLAAAASALRAAGAESVINLVVARTP